MAPLPLLKIFAVLFKEISKPLAASIKREAVAHPTFKELTMTVGRTYENFTQRVERTFSGNRNSPLKPVAEAHALHVGADLISQGFLLSTAIGLVCVEYWRGLLAKEVERKDTAEKKAYRQSIKEARIAAIEGDMSTLREKLTATESALESVKATLAQLESRQATHHLPEASAQEGDGARNVGLRTDGRGRGGWLW